VSQTTSTRSPRLMLVLVSTALTFALSLQAQVTHLVSFSTLEPDFAAGDADRIVQSASRLFEQKDALGHLMCALKFQRWNNVLDVRGVESKIENKTDLDRISAMPALVKIVTKISFCDGKFGSFAGCTSQDPTRHDRYNIIIVRVLPPLEGILFAHEYGHLKGLYHVERPQAVMRRQLSADMTRVDACECAFHRRSHVADDKDARTVRHGSSSTPRPNAK
jgi:hypothetical protein